MSTARLLTTIQCYKKKVILLLAILFFFSLLVIALDQHLNGFSRTCLICQTKISINGISDSYILEFYPTITCHVLEENLLNFTLPLVFPFQNKSPPPYFMINEPI